MNIQSTVKRPFQAKLTERDPGQAKVSTGLENVLKNTTGDFVDPENTFVVFKDQALRGKDEHGVEVLQVSTATLEGSDVVVEQGWVPKAAFREVDDAYYLPTYKYSTTSSLIGGAARGLVSGGVAGAATGAISGLAASRVGDSSLKRLALGTLVGTGAMTAFQAAAYGSIGLPSAVFAGAMMGMVAAGSGDGDARVRDSMLGGTAAGLAATMVTGLPLGMLTGTAATAVGSQVESRLGQVLLSAGVGAALTVTQALISGNSPLLAAGIGAAVGAVGSLTGPGLGQAGRNLQAKIEPLVAKGAGKLLEGRGETSYQVASALPQALAFGSLGASLGLVSPVLAPVGIALGASLGGARGFIKAGQRIDQLKDLQEKRVAALAMNSKGDSEQ